MTWCLYRDGEMVVACGSKESAEKSLAFFAWGWPERTWTIAAA